MKLSLFFLFGGDSGGETPVPIPNTEVKPSSADGTSLVTRWESRTLPKFIQGPSSNKEGPFFYFGQVPQFFPSSFRHFLNPKKMIN